MSVRFATCSVQIARHADVEAQAFHFDHVYGEGSRQEELFQGIGMPIIDNAFQWCNSTLFAYGQTGAGKTHSMLGYDADDSEERGLIPRVVQEVFRRVEAESERFIQKGLSKQLTVRCSYIEIYNERLIDLFKIEGPGPPPLISDSEKLSIRTHPELGVYVKNALEPEVISYEEVRNLMKQGDAKRKVASHAMNERSSRSHACITLKIYEVFNVGARRINKRWAKINLVDLAGSERQKMTHAEGVRLTESSNINKSLMTLQKVIKTLVRNSNIDEDVEAKAVVPYRESKLTTLLSESLGGNSLCCVLACVSPSESNMSMTLGTLKYAASAKTIKQIIVQNKELTEVDKLRDEVELLKAELGRKKGDELERMQADYDEKIEGMMYIIQQSAAESEEWAKRMSEERTKMLEHMAPHERACLLLQELGAYGVAKGIKDLEAELQRKEAEYQQQRKFVGNLEDALQVLIEPMAYRVEKLQRVGDAETSPFTERGLLDLLTQLKTCSTESSRLKALRVAIAELFQKMVALLQAEEDRLAQTMPGDMLAGAHAEGGADAPADGSPHNMTGGSTGGGGTGRLQRDRHQQQVHLAAMRAIAELKQNAAEGMGRLKDALGKGGDLSATSAKPRGMSMEMLFTIVAALPEDEAGGGGGGRQGHRAKSANPEDVINHHVTTVARPIKVLSCPSSLHATVCHHLNISSPSLDTTGFSLCPTMLAHHPIFIAPSCSPTESANLGWGDSRAIDLELLKMKDGELDELKAVVEEMYESNEVANNDIANLQQDIARSDNERAHAVAGLRAQIAQQAEELAAAASREKRLVEERDALSERVKRHLAQVAEGEEALVRVTAREKGRVKELEDELAKRVEALATTKAEKEAIEKELADLRVVSHAGEASGAHAQKELGALREEVLQRMADARALQAANEAAAKDTAEKRVLLHALEKETALLKSDVQSREEEVKRLRAESDELRKQLACEKGLLAAVTEQGKAKDAEIARLTAELDKAHAEVSSLRVELGSERGHKAAEEKQNERLAAKLAAAQEQKEEEERERRRVAAELETAQRRRAEMEELMARKPQPKSAACHIM
eukprot:jgi/Mesvir1/27152/Mv20817-RA.1